MTSPYEAIQPYTAIQIAAFQSMTSSRMVQKQPTSLMAFNGLQSDKDKHCERALQNQKDGCITREKFVMDNGKFIKGPLLSATIDTTSSDFTYIAKSRYEGILGIPASIGNLEWDLFFGLPEDDFDTFPYEFLQAIPVGADLSMVIDCLAYWILTDKTYGIHNFTGSLESVKKATLEVQMLFERRINGDEPTEQEWNDADSTSFHASHDAVKACRSTNNTTAVSRAVSNAHSISTNCYDYRISKMVKWASYAAHATYWVAAEGDYIGVAFEEDYYTAVKNKLLELLTAAPAHADYKAAA